VCIVTGEIPESAVDYGFKEDMQPGEVLQQFTEAATYRVDPPERLSDDELRKFVGGVLDGSIFTSAQLHDESLLTVVFMPLGLGIFRYHSEAEIKAVLSQTGVCYSYMKDAGPRNINGYPMFFSCGLLHIDDWRRAREAVIVEQERRKAIPLPP